MLGGCVVYCSMDHNCKSREKQIQLLRVENQSILDQLGILRLKCNTFEEDTRSANDRFSCLKLLVKRYLTHWTQLYIVCIVCLVQDYFLETLEERDYFGRKATFTALSETLCWRKFSQLTRTAFSRPYPPTPSRLFLQITVRLSVNPA